MKNSSLRRLAGAGAKFSPRNLIMINNSKMKFGFFELFGGAALPCCIKASTARVVYGEHAWVSICFFLCVCARVGENSVQICRTLHHIKGAKKLNCTSYCINFAVGSFYSA